MRLKQELEASVRKAEEELKKKAQDAIAEEEKKEKLEQIRKDGIKLAKERLTIKKEEEKKFYEKADTELQRIIEEQEKLKAFATMNLKKGMKKMVEKK